MKADVVIRPATANDLTTATAWLASAGLPTADLTAAHMRSFLLAFHNDGPVGMIGLESYVECGLLRSLFVDDASRGLGLGAKLVAALEAKANDAGMHELWLLTIDADPFFARHDYQVMQRGDAPTAVKNSAEFSSLCPGDAVLMRKQIQAS